jgi:hypothetical protein
VRSSPRSGTDGGRPIRSAPMADLAAAAELAVMRHFDRLKCAVEKRSGFAHDRAASVLIVGARNRRRRAARRRAVRHGCVAVVVGSPI